MNNKIVLWVAILVIGCILFEPAIAGPGGQIARVAFATFWGKVLLGILLVIFMPIGIYLEIRERLAARRVKKDLRFMEQYGSEFSLFAIQARVKDCFYRIHSGWENEDLWKVNGWMTDWYWQNQQVVYLNRWKREGLKNVCEVKNIKKITPLYFAHWNDGAEHEGSRIVFSITANMKDYLQERESGKIVEGSKRSKNVETIWSFVMENGQWKVFDIEQNDMSSCYIDSAKNLPDIETTLASDLKA